MQTNGPDDDATTCDFCRLPLAPDEEGLCRECYPFEPCVECGQVIEKADGQPCEACVTQMINAVVAEMYAERERR
jgi:hypothetical protein